MNDVKREAIARIDALSDENECLRDMLNDIAYTLGLDMSEVRYRSEDNYTECQNEVLYEIERRLMPKGMEWPCFESGEQVKFGDKFERDGSVYVVNGIEFAKLYRGRFVFCIWFEVEGRRMFYEFKQGQRVKRPPILDADGAEIHKGDTVYAAPGVGDDGWVIPYTVGRVHDGGVDLICDGESEPSLIHIGGERLTHKQYVLAKDSKPIEVGQTLYGEDGVAWHICALHPGKRYEVESDSTSSLEIRADGTVRHKRLKAEWLTHEKPDTWDRFKHDLFIELSDKSGYPEDVRKEAVAAFVDRAKRLAERGADTGIDRLGEVE